MNFVFVISLIFQSTLKEEEEETLLALNYQKVAPWAIRRAMILFSFLSDLKDRLLLFYLLWCFSYFIITLSYSTVFILLYFSYFKFPEGFPLGSSLSLPRSPPSGPCYRCIVHIAESHQHWLFRFRNIVPEPPVLEFHLCSFFSICSYRGKPVALKTYKPQDPACCKHSSFTK